MASSPGRPRQISVADPLWEIFSTMAEESGSRVDALVNQAMFERAVKLGYVTPVARESAPPLEEGEKPSPAGARVSRRMTAAQAPASGGQQQKFAPGRTREAAAATPGDAPAVAKHGQLQTTLPEIPGAF